MDIERALISKCVQGGLIETLVSREIAGVHFEDEDTRAVFQTCVQHMARWGSAPSMDVVREKHPQYRFDVVTDTLDFLIDKFIKHVQKREGRRSVLDLASAIDEPDIDLDVLFMEHAERVARVIPTSKISRLSDVKSRIEKYNELLRTGRIPGVPLGIPTLDRTVLGVQHHELVVVTAPSSVGKSTMLQYNALAAYLAGPEHRPVFITLEMEADAVLRKFDTMATNFQYHALRALELGEGDLQKWEEWGERAESAPNDIIIIDDIAECTVERVHAETLRWKPSAMFVDYFGIMTPARTGRDQQQHVSMSNMAKALKRVPRTTKIPLFTAAQTNRAGFKEGVKAEHVADTIEIFRSADIMLGLELDEDESNTMHVKLVKSRDSPRTECIMHWDLERMEFHERGKFAKKQPAQAPAAVAAEPEAPKLLDNPFWLKEIGAPS